MDEYWNNMQLEKAELFCKQKWSTSLIEARDQKVLE